MVLGNASRDDASVVGVENVGGEGAFVLICDHGSNVVPDRLRGLGLDAAVLNSWTAYDPGSLDLAMRLAQRLDSPLVYPAVSRLVIECNRPLTAPDLIAGKRGSVDIPGNRNIGEAERVERIETIYNVYHETVDAMIALRGARLRNLISIHTFPPDDSPAGVSLRVGVAAGDDGELVAKMTAALSDGGDLSFEIRRPNEPYDMIFHTLQRHAESRGVAGMVFQVRSDQAANVDELDGWADRLATVIHAVTRQDRSRRQPSRPRRTGR